ncbi:MAG: contractile injection system protein, VgrG/Pvc8 family [Clostridium sp.]|nr:contractile injection system protein, VgrG/Pvc8 family [Clostridium sp.]
MRDYQIKIEPFAYIALQEFTINRTINEHAKATLIMRIKDEWKEEYMGILAEETWVRITGIDKADGGEINTVLFHGIVTGYSFSQDGYETLMKLDMTSGTILMDLKQHFRVFQREETLCADIHRKIAAAYPDNQVLCTEGGEDKTEGVLVQFQETDWEFLKRLAGRTGLYLVPDALKKGVKYTIGLPEGTKRTIETDKLQTKLDINEYMEKSRNGMTSLQSGDMVELVIESREIFQLGDAVPYNGKEYFICKIQTSYQGAECSHAYFLRTKEALRVLPIENKAQQGCSFDAVITDVNKDKVQVEIMQDEWKAADGKKWFLYSTVYSSADGTGWYCMPEIGDSVRFYVPDKSENSFILSAVHKETDSARQNPDYKSLKTKYGKEILFTPDSILMTNNNGMMVELNDSEGITIASDKDIFIQADSNLTISSSAASLLIAADDKVQVKQGGTTMTLSDDIYFTGGEFRIQ